MLLVLRGGEKAATRALPLRIEDSDVARSQAQLLLLLLRRRIRSETVHRCLRLISQHQAGDFRLLRDCSLPCRGDDILLTLLAPIEHGRVLLSSWLQLHQILLRCRLGQARLAEEVGDGFKLPLLILQGLDPGAIRAK